MRDTSSTPQDQLDLFQNQIVDNVVRQSGQKENIPIPVFLSNSLHELVDSFSKEIIQLRKSCYTRSEATIAYRPYRYLILVPSEEKRSWLYTQLALNDISSFDIEIVTPQGLQHAFQENPVPSWRSSLLPAVQECIARLVESNDYSSNYQAHYITARSFEADIATRLFSNHSDLFKESEENKEPIWNLFYKLFPDLVWSKDRLFDREDINFFSQYRAFFVFGVTSLAQSILEYCLAIFRLGIPGSIYVFSPCLHFWSDSKSDAEVKRALDTVKKKNCSVDVLQQYEMLLYDRNTLLANLGVMAREFAQEIEENGLHTYPVYVIPEKISERFPYHEYLVPEFLKVESSVNRQQQEKAPTLLSMLQSDILLFIPQRKKPDYLEQHDSSMRCVITTTLYQEVERFYQYVINKTLNDNIFQVGSVIVVVPDISLYREPFLRYFHSEQPLQIQFWEGSESTLPRDQKISIKDWIDVLFQMVTGEPVKSDKIALGSLTSRSSYAMKSFVMHPLTLRAIRVNVSDTLLESEQEASFLFFLDKIGLNWNISKEHAERELARHGLRMTSITDSSGNFIERGQAILEELLGFKGSNGLFTQGVEYDLLNSFLSCIGLLESLEKIWNMPCLEEQVMTIEELTGATRASLELILHENIDVDEGDLEAFEATCQLFYGLHARCPHVKMPVSWFHEAFLREITRMMKREAPQLWKGHIIVVERRQFDLVPCDGVALLGVSQDIFPEKSKDHFFSHLEQCSPKVPHDISLIDRSLFLETLLYPSQWWYASAHGIRPTESRAPLSIFSPLVRDLIHYIDDNYRLPQGALFSDVSLHVVKSYIGALLPCNQKKIHDQKVDDCVPLQGFGIDGSESIEVFSETTATMRHISDLVQVGKSPLETFLETTFQLKSSHFYLLENYQKKRGTLAIFPSQSAITEYTRRLLEKEDREVINKKISQRWPKGIPGNLIERSCRQEADLIVHDLCVVADNTIDLSILQVVLFDYEFGEETIEGTSKNEEVVSLPIINFGSVKKFYLSGTLRHSCIEHMALITKKWEQELFQRFPEYLVRLAVFYKYAIGSQSCLVVDKREIIHFHLDESTVFNLLVYWCEFYDEVKNTPFPFTFNIVKTLLSKIDDSLDEITIVDMLFRLLEDESAYNTSLTILLPLFTREYISKSYRLWKLRAQQLYSHYFLFLEEKK